MEPNKQTIKVIVNAVEVVKSGKSTGKDGKVRNWTIYKVQAANLADGKTGYYGTFDDLTAKVNSEVDVNVWSETKEVNGKSYTNLKLELPKRNAWAELADHARRITALENFMLGANKKGLPNATSIEDEEISMPF